MLNFLSGALLDRCSNLRRDSAWLEIAFQDPAARILCYSNGEPLIRFIFDLTDDRGVGALNPY